MQLWPISLPPFSLAAIIPIVVGLMALTGPGVALAEGEVPKEPVAPRQAMEYEKMSLAEIVRKARAGDLRAQYELGSRFEQGRGVPKNINEALQWLRAAAQRGHREALRRLALIYYQGNDIPADHNEAFKWTVRLAESGDGPGQTMLGNLYANGEGTPRDLIRAYAWYDIAATSAGQALESGDLQAQAELDDALAKRSRMAALLLPSEEAEAQLMASNWWFSKMGVKLPLQPPELPTGHKAR